MARLLRPRHAMRTIIGARLSQFSGAGSMGVVSDTRYIRCFWPRLDQPTALFAEGSSGIEVQGPPAPRNVVFPADTISPEYYPDALYPAEQALFAAFPQKRAIVDLTDDQAIVYLAAYDEVVKEFPDTHTRHSTRIDIHFLRHTDNLGFKNAVRYFDAGPFESREEFLAFKTADFGCLDITKSPHYSMVLAEWERGPRKVGIEEIVKESFQDYVALLSSGEVADVISEAKAPADLKADAVFVKAEQSFEDPDTKYHRIVDGKPVDVTAELEALAEVIK